MGEDDKTMGVGSIDAALAEVERWRAEEESRHREEIKAAETEIRNLEAALVKVQSQLEAVRKYRSELATKAETVGEGQIGRAYQMLFDVLIAQASRLEERGARTAEREAARRATLPKLLADSDVGSLLNEFRQFKDETEPALERLPESYRSVLLRHHHGVVNRLRDYLMRILSAPPEIEEEDLLLDVVYAVDAPEDTPELLVIVLPVREEAYSEWQSRGDSLPLSIAARVVQAVYEAAVAVSFARAQVVAGGHRCLLVIEVDLQGADPAFLPHVAGQLDAVLSSAQEIVGAKVRIVPREVKIDYVLPPETEDQPSAEESASEHPIRGEAGREKTASRDGGVSREGKNIAEGEAIDA